MVKGDDKRQQETIPYVLPLRAPETALSGRVGTKATNLSRLLAAGFPVPDGIVVTTAAFAAHVAATFNDPGQAADVIVKKPLPAPIEEALHRALAAFGDAPLAVRSSGVAEDLAGASFAGQYETVLNVRGYNATADAVCKCWASAFSGHILTYQTNRELGADRMAVLIQPMIEADAAGVAFTANPVTGDRSETVVSAVRGLGERLVSGQASPDEWVVREGRAVCRSSPENALGEREVLAVAELARQVEKYFGNPQDIEWVLKDGKLYLLQARPITTLSDAGETEPVPVPVEPPSGYWERGDSHYPQPLYPLTRSVLLPAANPGFRKMCTEFGLLTETVEEREIGGWVYLRMVPLGGKDRPPLPDWLTGLLIRLLPSLRARIRDCTEAARADKAGKCIEQWYAEFKPNLIKQLTALRDTKLQTLPADGLDRHAEAVSLLVRESQEMHMMLNQSLNLLLAEFTFTCRDLLGWKEEQAFEMLSGLSETSSAPARALARIAQQVRENPSLSDLFQQTDRPTLERMAAADAGFAKAFASYQREFGCRTIRYEVADPTLAETPELLLALIANQISRNYNPEADAQALAEKRAHLVSQARRMLSGRPAAERDRFERAMTRAERAYPVREEHGFYDTSMPLALLRYISLEMGRRLVEHKQIAKQDDVFFLEFKEARMALGTGENLHELVARRKGERAWVLANPGPASYGTLPPAPPSFAALPAEARWVHEAVMWFYERVFAAAASGSRQADARALKGIAASAGRYTGPVRVILSESEFHRIQPGDVLVCPITSPVWSVLFPSVGALVTDSGGFLSHSAIIAREYHIPAVVATGNATQILRDGQLVTVEGATGTVSVEGLH
ncbi:PEP/pyruvate-binding domain-containing protein [Desulfoscipio gibsoniae]|uniref:Phosphoenolpyruvate synthase/pyruvate phosphate dikinase n=1 Tax=Desulfoscipio gibsoniae DSM 7213 TaxID=767817 RepID=R4KJZ6_9FIRM|nr:PEP/pyruvate-binding domain-containing protein [Desulfoscipio gibsoniae]AGL03498.1 phosphoenolpyruvate synthase/pyruvate phosphate dikinase [Desulfoscipio gibsoniae DSM 7213]